MQIINHEVFISYASRDRERVLDIVRQLESAGVRVWFDGSEIKQNYGPEIVRAIKTCKVLTLMCTDASMRSRNVKQEIQLAWKYGLPYLPLMLEQISFPEQLEYWLEGWQWVEIMDYPAERWLPRVLQAMAYIGVQCQITGQVEAPDNVVQPTTVHQGLQGLLSVARFTDQIWPVPAHTIPRGVARSLMRDLGAPQDHVQHGYKLGSRIRLAIESHCEGHLLLLDAGTSGRIYCLCPSQFAPDTHLPPGRSYLPQANSRYDSFVVTGQPGREELLAIVTDEPLELDWMPTDPKTPARVLTSADIETLLAQLRDLDGDSWTALSTYFDVVL